MQLAVLQFLDIEPPERLGDIIAAHGHALNIHRLWRRLPSLDELLHADAWLIMGGPASANDDSPVIRLCLKAIREAIQTGKPMLGICLGSQLMAKAAGGEIITSPSRELGWYPVHPTLAATDDPLFRHMPETLHVFQWHGESFTLPDSAALLATNPDVPHQAFRLGPAQYGLQFHVEVGMETIEHWIQAGESERLALGESGIATIRNDTPRFLAPMHQFCRSLVQGWLAEQIEHD